MDFFTRIFAWIETTAMHEQISNVDIAGLFTNPWFIVPFAFFVGYSLWKQSWMSLVIAGVCIGLWYATGTEYMQGMVDENGEINTSKILPIVGVGAGLIFVLGIMIFGRSE